MSAKDSSYLPLFSVVIPTYNRANMLREAIETALNQTYNDVEVVVVDDGSTDGTQDVVDSFGRKVRSYRQENAGVAAARNKGVSVSTGRYICYLDSDDLWPATKLETVAKAIQKFPDSSFIFSDFRKHNVNLPEPYDLSNSEMFPLIWDHGLKLDEQRYLFSGTEKLGLLMRGYPLYPSTFVIKRDVHEQFRWDPGILKSEDFNFVLRVSKAYDLLYIHADLATVRVHETNKSADFLTKNRTNLLSMKLYRDLYASSEQTELCNYYISMRQFREGRSYLSKGLYSEGAKLILRSLAYTQNWKRLVRKIGNLIREEK